MCFMPVPETKTIKNRVHLDLTTGADDRDAEIERLLRLGARRVNIGQTGDEILDRSRRSGGLDPNICWRPRVRLPPRIAGL